ncbi:hypothetical protein Save01_03133 [Streptomyces avermitilis]
MYEMPNEVTQWFTGVSDVTYVTGMVRRAFRYRDKASRTASSVRATSAVPSSAVMIGR